jgi:Ca2+-binding EF-hand superfamily protein
VQQQAGMFGKKKPRTRRFKHIIHNAHVERFMRELEVKEDDVHALHEVFEAIDKDRSGTVELQEFFEHCDMDYTPFAARAFGAMDVLHTGDSKHSLHFQEFMIGLFNYCTLTHNTLVKFAYDILPHDEQGEVNTDQVRLLVDEIYGGKIDDRVRRLLKVIDKDHSGNIDFSEFRALEKKSRLILFPAFMLQHGMQGKIMNARFWERATERRTAALGDQDLIEWHYAVTTGSRLKRGGKAEGAKFALIEDAFVTSEKGAPVHSEPSFKSKGRDVVPKGTRIMVYDTHAAEPPTPVNAGAAELMPEASAPIEWWQIGEDEKENPRWILGRDCEQEQVVGITHIELNPQERLIKEKEERRKKREHILRVRASEDAHKRWVKVVGGVDGRSTYWVDADSHEVSWSKPVAPFVPD